MAPRRPVARLAPEALEDRLAPAQFTFAGVTFEQDSTPDLKTALAAGTYSGAIVTATPTTATGSITQFPGSTGFNNQLALGALIDASNGPRALNLPAGNNGAANRSGVELAWSGNRALQNQTGNDLVVYESGTVAGASRAPEAFMIQVRDAATGTWSAWYYVPATASGTTSGNDGLFVHLYDLTDLGIAAEGYIDRVRLVNVTNEDRTVEATGVGFVIPEDNGATSTNLPNPGALASFSAFGASTLDPDPLYVGAFNALSAPLADVGVTVTDGTGLVTIGDTVTYTITVTNAGPNAATGAALAVSVPTNLTNLSFTSAASGGATGNTATGTGAPTELLNLPTGSSVTYQLTGTVSSGGALNVSATVTAPNTVTDFNASNDTASDLNAVVAQQQVASPSPPPPVRRFGVGSGNGLAAVVDQSGAVLFAGAPFAGYTGAVRVATGDFNGDSVDDIVLSGGTAFARGLVRVHDGATGALLVEFSPLTGLPVGDADVAVADADGDGVLDLLVSNASAGSDVRAFNFARGFLFGFTALPGARGVNVAAGDIDGDGVADIVVASAGGPPVVASYSTRTGFLFGFNAVGTSYTGGLEVAVGNLFGDARNEVVVSTTGPGVLNFVQVFPALSATAAAAVPLGAAFGVGARVGAADVDGDGRAELLVGTGTGVAARVLAVDLFGNTLDRDFVPFGGTGGAFVESGAQPVAVG